MIVQIGTFKHAKNKITTKWNRNACEKNKSTQKLMRFFFIYFNFYTNVSETGSY